MACSRSSFKEGWNIKAKQKMAKNRARGNKHGQMVLIMMDSGKMTWPGAREDFTSLMELSTREIFFMTNFTDMAHT